MSTHASVADFYEMVRITGHLRTVAASVAGIDHDPLNAGTTLVTSAHPEQGRAVVIYFTPLSTITARATLVDPLTEALTRAGFEVDRVHVEQNNSGPLAITEMTADLRL
ncbi:hypothetical protein ABZ234_08065 [Nocardiopsis sp. NPDC006198]|uniref:hypothetical protein n=1 Tax=Nocardiopsis sp. NPDC006198 TaxID=3154472 RepID=UPI0033B2635B